MTYTIENTDTFNDWLDNLRDRQARQKIAARIRLIETEGYLATTKA